MATIDTTEHTISGRAPPCCTTGSADIQVLSSLSSRAASPCFVVQDPLSCMSQGPCEMAIPTKCRSALLISTPNNVRVCGPQQWPSHPGKVWKRVEVLLGLDGASTTSGSLPLLPHELGNRWSSACHAAGHVAAPLPSTELRGRSEW